MLITIGSDVSLSGNPIRVEDWSRIQIPRNPFQTQNPIRDGDEVVLPIYLVIVIIMEEYFE